MPGVRRALLLLITLSLLPAAARADDPYADFRVPEHRQYSWFVQANGSTRSFQSDGPEGSNHQSTPFGNLLSEMLWSHESDARQSAVLITVEAVTIQNHARFETSSQGLDQASRHAWDNRQVLFLAGSQRRYWTGSRFALDFDARAALDWNQREDSSARHILSDGFESFEGDGEHAASYQPSGSASLGIGYGRVRDATGVFEAQLIEQRLRATGHLTRALSPAALTSIAQLHYIERDFFTAHDRPTRYFWQQVERVLSEDGALREGGLDAYSLLRLLEPITGGRTFIRQAGGFVRPFVFGSVVGGHEDVASYFERQVYNNGVLVFTDANQSSQRNELDEQESGAGLGLEYHRPVGMRWQSDASAVATYGGGSRRDLDLSSAAQVQYMIADRWFASGRLDVHSHSQLLNEVRSEPSWSVSGQASLSYLVEDSWSLDLRSSLLQQQLRNQAFEGGGLVRSSTISFGLTYQPYGRFDAPGLGVSQHLVTPPL